MIRFRCPKCDKRLAVDGARAGGVGVCPGCKNKFRIPAAPDAEQLTSAPPKKPRPVREDAAPPPVRRARRVEEDDELTPQPVRRGRRVEEDDDLTEQDERAERRPVRKRKRKRRGSASGLPLGMDAFTAGLAGAGLVSLISLGLAFLLPAASFLPLGLGWLLMTAGGIWFLIVAFQDSAVAGLLCLLVPCYSLYYLLTHFDEEKRPFFVQLLGTVLVMASSCVGAASAGAR